MPRPKKGSVSKKAAVERFLEQGLANKDVVEAVKKAYGFTVSATYVSIIKSKRNKALGIVTRGKSRTGHDPLTAAIQFVKAAGSLDAAKRALATVEQIRQLA